jgi:undecaprenyl-diphosphatase
MEKNEKILITLSAITLILFILLVLNISTTNSINVINYKINSEIQNIQTPNLIEISKVIGIIIDPAPMIIFGIILSILLWFLYSKKEASFLFLSMLTSGILIILIKQTVRISRPENSLIQNTFLSFPSGHTTIAIVLLGIFCYWILKSRRKKIYKYLVLIASALISLIVAFSRIYLNAHWFSDVLAGFCLGAFILTLSLFIKIKYFKSK